MIPNHFINFIEIVYFFQPFSLVCSFLSAYNLLWHYFSLIIGSPRSLIIGLWFACCSLLNLRLLIFILCFCRTYFAYLVFVFGVTQFFAYYVCILFWKFHAFGANTLIYIYTWFIYILLSRFCRTFTLLNIMAHTYTLLLTFIIFYCSLLFCFYAFGARTYFAYLFFVFGVTQFFAYVCILFWNFHACAHTLLYIIRGLFIFCSHTFGAHSLCLKS